MRKSTSVVLAALGLVAGGLAGAGSALAQGSPPRQDRLIQVPLGAVVLVLPAGEPFGSMPQPIFDAGGGFPAMPSPVAMMREMEQMMANVQRAFANSDWANSNWANSNWAEQNRAMEVAIPQDGGQVRTVVVTSFTDSNGTCTQRIVYAGNGAAPKVDVSSTRNACAGAGVPATLPLVVPHPQRSAPRTLMVDNRSGAAPVQVAQLNN